VGVIIRLNQKSVTLRIDDSDRWIISPLLLTKIDEWPSQRRRDRRSFNEGGS
jgi:hypothetical protein